MKLTIIGGGGFRVPQIYQALSSADAPIRVDEVCLYDIDATRIDKVRSVIAHLEQHASQPVRVTATTSLDEALRGADFVFSAMRVGGAESRVLDERVALGLGVLGQETVGPGGLAYALRTLPHARNLAREIQRIAPDAWVINFTNPAGVITEAMRAVLGSRVVGICDTPIGLMRRVARTVGSDPSKVEFDYVGLNHLGWLRSLNLNGRDIMQEILADDAQLGSIEEARVIGMDWVRALGAIPNEYLFYYYYPREALERITTSPRTRGQYLVQRQGEFYSSAAGSAYEQWSAVLHERESSYMQESRTNVGQRSRLEEDVEGGGYQKVALDLMTGLSGGPAAVMILNVSNDAAGGDRLVPELGDQAVIEVPCRVDVTGIHPQRVKPVRGDMLGLMTQVKASEQLILSASEERSPELAWRAFANHPLVDSVAVAKRLLDEYSSQIPGVASSLGR
ncbi:6-phospho-beta-glucosidase [Microbacterium sp. Mu-80]|uniref:6-phospho-beta-glucosidase n=1 Tax=Microbacterium bandirmense TaxID=3122050 RepID=A0ABU8LBP5_9MICO